MVWTFGTAVARGIGLLDPATRRHDNPSKRRQAFTPQQQQHLKRSLVHYGSQADCSSVSTVTPNSRGVGNPSAQRPAQFQSTHPSGVITPNTFICTKVKKLRSRTSTTTLRLIMKSVYCL